MASFISSDALEQIGTFDADATPIKRRGGRGFTPTKPRVAQPTRQLAVRGLMRERVIQKTSFA